MASRRANGDAGMEIRRGNRIGRLFGDSVRCHMTHKYIPTAYAIAINEEMPANMATLLPSHSLAGFTFTVPP